MFLKIVEAKYLEGYKIELKFNDSSVGIVDLKEELWGEVFEPLIELENFKNFSLNNGTIEWYNGADFAPEFLHTLSSTKQLKEMV